MRGMLIAAAAAVKLDGSHIERRKRASFV